MSRLVITIMCRSQSAAHGLLLRLRALAQREIFLISGLARCHDCGVPDVAAVNMMRGFLHDHRGSRRIGYPTLCQDGARLNLF